MLTLSQWPAPGASGFGRLLTFGLLPIATFGQPTAEGRLATGTGRSAQR